MLLKNIAIILSIIMVLGVSTASARPAVMDPLVEKTVKKNYKATSLEPISLEGNGEASAYLVHTKHGVGLVSPTGALLLECKYRSISVFPAGPRTLGEYILPASSSSKYYLLEDDTSALGLAREDGTVLLPTVYDDIALLPAVNAGLTEFSKNGKKYRYYHPASKSSFLAKLRTSQIEIATQPYIHILDMDGNIKASLTDFYYLPGLIFGSTGEATCYDKLTPSINMTLLCGSGDMKVMPDGLFNGWAIMHYSPKQGGLLLSDGTPLTPFDYGCLRVYMIPDSYKAKVNADVQYIVTGKDHLSLMLRDLYGNNISDDKFVAIS